jgi:spore germination cell wall hydrolase CwlJ-like protein
MKKYSIAGAVAAVFLLLAPQLVHAPLRKPEYFHPPKERAITIESSLEKSLRENNQKLKNLDIKMNKLSRYETDSFYDDSTQLLLARLMLGEDEEHSDVCKIADAWTVLNRTMRNNSDIRTEILRPGQYSCFWIEDSKTFLKTPLKHSPLKYTQEFPIDLELARNFLSGKYEDSTHGATNYYNPKKVKGIPSWVKDMIFTVKIGDHLYYKPRN